MWRMIIREIKLVRKVRDYRVTYYENAELPRTDLPVSRLKGGTTILKELTKSIDLPLRRVMCIKLSLAFLGGGDASGRGFGGIIFLRNEVQFIYGQCKDTIIQMSSNYRELLKWNYWRRQ